MELLLEHGLPYTPMDPGNLAWPAHDVRFGANACWWGKGLPRRRTTFSRIFFFTRSHLAPFLYTTHNMTVGIDEAGRGPLAGPVAVGVAAVPAGFEWARVLPGVGDSKKLKPEDREAIFRRAATLRQAGELDYAVAMVGSLVIDRKGIVPAIDLALTRALTRLTTGDLRRDRAQEEMVIQLDGGLRVPERVFQKMQNSSFATNQTGFEAGERTVTQETIIKGDVSEPAIGLASIVAKVTRDRYMERMATRYPAYGFAEHKGYGTKAHRAAITAHGLCEIHRQTFCTNISAPYYP